MEKKDLEYAIYQNIIKYINYNNHEKNENINKIVELDQDNFYNVKISSGKIDISIKETKTLYSIILENSNYLESKNLKSFISQVSKNYVDFIFIIFNNSIKRQKEIIKSIIHNARIFNKDPFIFDLSDNIAVPKMEKITEDELNEFLEFYCITKSQLPQVKVSDPAIIWNGFKVGDVIKVFDASETSIVESLQYNLVIP